LSSTPLPRAEFAVTERYAYLNHAAVGVLPQRTKAALDAFVRAHADGGVMGVFPYENRMPEFRSAVGRFIGADGDDVAILRNTGDGANAIAGGLDWRDGDEMLLCDDEFPSNAVPWLALRDRGVGVRLFETAKSRLTPDALRGALTPKTRLVAVSWVAFHDGYMHDLAGLAEVAHANGTLLVADVMQALGGFPLDVAATGIDAAYAGGAKWLLALQGVAFLWTRAELRDRLRLAAPGWRSAADMWDFLNYEQGYIDAGSRFEGGTPNFIGALSLAESIAEIERAGPAKVAAHILAITDHLVEGLARAGADIASIRGNGTSSGIVTFSVPGHDPVALGRGMQHDDGVVTTWRPNGIRVAPHGYNSIDEIDRLLDALTRRIAKGPAT
jgi:cysteine desulfurase/selenocysteine lyase